MPLVDAHVHIFPDEIVHHRERFFERDDWFRQLYSPPRARLATTHELVESMDGAGIDVSIACGFPWRDPGLCRYHNDYMCEAARLYPDRIAWLAICSPVNGDAAARTLDDAISDGARGAGELNADAQGFDLGEPAELAAVVEVCMVREAPVMFHVSEPVGHPYPGKGTATPDKLLMTLAAFPGLRVVAAHWGGGLPFYALMPEVRALTTNLSYDSAATTFLYAESVFETTAALVGEERVLFASDYPLLKQGPLLRRVQARPWASESAEARVLGENAVQIYGLQEMLR